MTYNRLQDIPRVDLKGYHVNANIAKPLAVFEWHIKNGKFNIDPPYQRGYVWTMEQKERYIEHLLMGGTSGTQLYFNCPNWHEPKGDSDWHNTVEVVDGKQRISAMTGFANNEVKAFGKFLSEYEDHMRIVSPTHYVINVNVLNRGTMEEVGKLYLALNTGGSIHTEEDIAIARKYLNKVKGL